MDLDGDHPSAEQKGLKGFRARWRGADASEPLGEPQTEELSDVVYHLDHAPLFEATDGDSLEYSPGLTDWEACETQDNEVLDDVGSEQFTAENPFGPSWKSFDAHHVSDLFHVASPQVLDPTKREPEWKAAAVKAEVKRAKHDIGKLPWEVEGFGFRSHDRFHGTVLTAYDQLFAPTSIGAMDVWDSQIVRSRPESVSAAVDLPVVPVKLHRARHEPLDEDIRRRALLRFRDIILQDPLSTQLGASLRGRVECGTGHDDVDQSFRDAFRMKASSTLQKRAASLGKLSRYLRAAGQLYPLRLTEAHLYQALCSMREDGGGATSAQHILESLHFIDAIAKLSIVNLSQVISARCRGVARDMWMSKDPLQQKRPLTVEQVRRLESTMMTAGTVLRCILGQLLFCVHACCRWKDAQRLKSITIESGHGETLLHADALSSKTTLSAESRTRFLPYVAIGTGVSSMDWAALWLEARDAEGLTMSEHVLPSYSERHASWVECPMSASEATIWLREFLEGTAGFEPKMVGSHSCKATLLTWAGRSIRVVFSPTERRLLGHHLDPGMKSVLCYSRESFTALYSKVLSMLRLIRTADYDPDLPAIERVVQMADAADEPPQNTEETVGDGAGSDSDSSIASLESVRDGLDEGEPDGRVVSLFPSFPGVPETALMVHSISALVHVVNEDDVLLCGRPTSAHFKPYSRVSEREHLVSCRQCLRTFQNRRV
eukprot:s2882_g10.t1